MCVCVHERGGSFFCQFPNCHFLLLHRVSLTATLLVLTACGQFPCVSLHPSAASLCPPSPLFAPSCYSVVRSLTPFLTFSTPGSVVRHRCSSFRASSLLNGSFIVAVEAHGREANVVGMSLKKKTISSGSRSRETVGEVGLV